VADQDRPTSRAERRLRTEGRILTTAREQFAALGYERTTIRAVATEAGVDPALVMQYFGSKDELFRRATSMTPDAAAADDPGRLTEHLLTTIGLKLGDLPQTSLASLRSAFTHPEAAEHVREVLGHQIDRIAAASPTDGDDEAGDAELRAALVVALMVGISIHRHLIELPPLDTADIPRIAAILRPALDALVTPPPRP
jgi:AcrR family transcriptional regulator